MLSHFYTTFTAGSSGEQIVVHTFPVDDDGFDPTEYTFSCVLQDTNAQVSKALVTAASGASGAEVLLVEYGSNYTTELPIFEITTTCSTTTSTNSVSVIAVPQTSLSGRLVVHYNSLTTTLTSDSLTAVGDGGDNITLITNITSFTPSDIDEVIDTSIPTDVNDTNKIGDILSFRDQSVFAPSTLGSIGALQGLNALRGLYSGCQNNNLDCLLEKITSIRINLHYPGLGKQSLNFFDSLSDALLFEIKAVALGCVNQLLYDTIQKSQFLQTVLVFEKLAKQRVIQILNEIESIVDNNIRDIAYHKLKLLQVAHYRQYIHYGLQSICPGAFPATRGQVETLESIVDNVLDKNQGRVSSNNETLRIDL